LRRLLVVGLVAAAALTATAQARAETWCGTDEVSANRVPDLEVSSTYQVRVLYVVPADGSDRFPVLASAIATDIAAIDAWWQREDPTRAPRWDRFAFPGCTSRFGALDIGFVRLANGGDAYRDDGSRVTRLDGDLASLAPFTQKTIVFYDGPTTNPNLCGETDYLADHSGGRFGFAYVFLQSGCAPDPGRGGVTARVAVHELTHNLGAVLNVAPNACSDRSGHVCDSSNDLLYPTVTAGSGLGSASLDIGRNDYYGHSGSWWDVQDSAWLSHLPQFELHVAAQGSGAVTTSVAGDCSQPCTYALDNGLQVQLTPVASAGWRFTGWSGSCSGTAECSLTMDSQKDVLAVFALEPQPVKVAITGRGRVTSSPPGISCPGSCSHAFAAGAAVRLRAQPATGFRFTGWSGACRGNGACSVRADRVRSVRATFRRR
jgi:hypothetical protein